MRKLFRLFNREDGITGLETAIILIAFVIVASVFAFVVLSTGLFSAERGKETVFAGLEKARGHLQDRVPATGYTVPWILDDGDDLLENGELAEVTVNPPTGSTLVPNEIFTLEVVPPSGGTNLVNRTM